MMRTLTAITAFVALAGATLPAFADCAGHSQTVQTTTPRRPWFNPARRR